PPVCVTWMYAAGGRGFMQVGEAYARRQVIAAKTLAPACGLPCARKHMLKQRQVIGVVRDRSRVPKQAPDDFFIELDGRRQRCAVGIEPMPQAQEALRRFYDHFLQLRLIEAADQIPAVIDRLRQADEACAVAQM